MWRGDDNWDPKTHDLKSEIKTLVEDPHSINNYIEYSYSILEEIVLRDKKYSSDLDNALKSGNLDAEIDREFYGDTQPRKVIP